MKVHFNDTIAEVHEFTYRETYDGGLEGSYASFSKSILESLNIDARRNKGHLVFPTYRNEQKTELKNYRYSIFAKTDIEHRIFITWFDDDMDENMTAVEAIEKVTKNISFNAKCEFVDLDNW